MDGGDAGHDWDAGDVVHAERDVGAPETCGNVARNPVVEEVAHGPGYAGAGEDRGDSVGGLCASHAVDGDEWLGSGVEVPRSGRMPWIIGALRERISLPDTVGEGAFIKDEVPRSDHVSGL